MKLKKMPLILLISALAVIIYIAFVGIGPPKPSVSVGSKGIPTKLGSHCWKGLIKQQCVDVSGPPDLVEGQPRIASPGSKVNIKFRKPPKDGSFGISNWNASSPSEEVRLTGNTFTLPEKEGTYIFTIYGSWERGRASYAFKIKVKSSP